MLITERLVFGLLHNRKVYFPNLEEALNICGSLGHNEILRLFGVTSDLGAPRFLVRHDKLLTIWVDLCVGPEGILRGMKRKSCRYEIRRAEKMLGRVAIELNTQRAMEDFLPVYNHFAESKGPVPKLSMQKFHDHLKHGEVFVLYLDGRAVCGHLLLCDAQAGIAKLLYSGSRRLESAEDAVACGALNRYLHWHEMQHYHAKGFAIYDLGGIRFPEHPTARFKLSFGGRVVSEHYYLFSRWRRITIVGNLVFEKLFGHRPILSRIDNSEGPTSAIESCDTQKELARCLPD